MLCRIATISQAAEPIDWRNVDGDTAPLKYSPPGAALAEPWVASRSSASQADRNLAAQQAAARQTDLLERRLLELQATHQADLEYARQNGFEEGLRKGREDAAGELQNALDQLARAILDLSQQKRKIRREAERELVKLSLAVARRILHRELLADPESIQGIVYAALQKLQTREIARVRVYVAGAAAVTAALERAGHRNAVEVTADPMLAPGAILFETALGELDVSLETQLQEIERGFADRLALS